MMKTSGHLECALTGTRNRHSGRDLKNPSIYILFHGLVGHTHGCSYSVVLSSHLKINTALGNSFNFFVKA